MMVHVTFNILSLFNPLVFLLAYKNIIMIISVRYITMHMNEHVVRYIHKLVEYLAGRSKMS